MLWSNRSRILLPQPMAAWILLRSEALHSGKRLQRMWHCVNGFLEHLQLGDRFYRHCYCCCWGLYCFSFLIRWYYTYYSMYIYSWNFEYSVDLGYFPRLSRLIFYSWKIWVIFFQDWLMLKLIKINKKIMIISILFIPSMTYLNFIDNQRIVH